MIKLLILYELNKSVLTMYKISKSILSEFSVLTTPSFGSISPALKSMEKEGLVKSQKEISQGGRVSKYYSVTASGIKTLEELIIEVPSDNPVQFLANARIKLICSNILNDEKKLAVIRTLKNMAQGIMLEINTLLKSENQDYCKRMVYDNLVCEYRNFIILLEGFESACKNK